MRLITLYINGLTRELRKNTRLAYNGISNPTLVNHTGIQDIRNIKVTINNKYIFFNVLGWMDVVL